MKRILLATAMTILAAGPLRAADLPLGHADFVPTSERPVGWRGDGTGRYIGATPVTDWDVTTGKNIIWKTRFTGFSFAGPTVVGDRVFTTAEPDLLICVDAKTGKELWRRHNAIHMEAIEAKERERLYGICDQLLEIAGKWSRLPAVQADGTPYADVGDFVELWAPCKPKVDAMMPALAAQRGVDLEQMRAMFREVGRANKVEATALPGKQALLNTMYSWTGNMPGTPASDGKRVVVKAQSASGWGYLVCYDLDGNRQWHVEVGKMGDWGYPYHSPLIHGGHVLTEARWSSDPLNGNIRFKGKENERFAAFDLGTGKILWNVPSRQRTSSPVVVVVDGIPVVMIANKFYLPETGAEVLDLNPYICSDVDTPCVDGDRIFFKGGEGKTIANEGKGPGRFNNPAAIVRVFWKDKGKTLAYEEVWKQLPKGIGWTRGSVLFADGWIYRQTGKTEPSMFAMDTKVAGVKGQGFKPNAAAGLGGRGVPNEDDMSCVMGGKFVFGCPSNWPSQFVIITHGPGTKVVGAPVMDGAVMGPPAFQGGRMYVRDYNYLYCIGAK